MTTEQTDPTGSAGLRDPADPDRQREAAADQEAERLHDEEDLDKLRTDDPGEPQDRLHPADQERMYEEAYRRETRP